MYCAGADYHLQKAKQCGKWCAPGCRWRQYVQSPRYWMKTDTLLHANFVQSVDVLDLQGHDISCQMNTDGVKLFKSGDADVWPIYISINELPYKRRRQFTSLVGLWFGDHKPNMATFFKPFIRHCNEFVDEPLVWTHQGQTYKSRVYFPLCTADSVARPALQGLKQFNGFYGCPWCICPGVRPKVKHSPPESSKH